jgi:phosphatidylserine decarboxylase
MIIMIGGLFVGSIQLFVNEAHEINAGDKIGYFNFGSSVLLLHNENDISHKLHDITKICHNL